MLWVPGKRDNMSVIVLCDYSLFFCFPDNELPICPGTREECTIGRPGKVRYITGMTTGKSFVSFPFCSVDNDDIYSVSACTIQL